MGIVMTDGPICRLLMSLARLVGVELALVCSTRARAPVERHSSTHASKRKTAARQEGHLRSRRPKLRDWRLSSGYPLGICHRADVVWSVLWLSCGAPEYDFGCFD